MYEDLQVFDKWMPYFWSVGIFNGMHTKVKVMVLIQEIDFNRKSYTSGTGLGTSVICRCTFDLEVFALHPSPNPKDSKHIIVFISYTH